MIATRLGLRVLLVERGRHPRFAIGESASPLAGVLIENLADCYDLPRVRPFASYGEWRRHYPDVVCGLKRGFTYYKHAEGQAYAPAPDRSNQLLVAASPCDEISDTHWLRADVDHFLVREAIALGVEYLDQTTLESLEWQPNGDAVVAGMREARPLRFRSRLIPVNLLLLSSRFKTICPQPKTGKKAFVVGGTLKVPTIVLPACLAT